MRTSKLLLLTIALCSNVYAQDIKIVGTLDQTLKLNSPRALNSKVQTKHIKLLKVKLSPYAINVINQRTNNTINNPSFSYEASELPSKIELGMNEVPVLDQGQHGTCVTFATTAAVDAALNKGDYISQLCQLQLGLYLEKQGYTASGWNGSYGRWVLSQMEHFGIINKEKQQSIGCGGLTEYPKSSMPGEDSAMSLEQFHELSESLDAEPIGVTYSPILDIAQTSFDIEKTVYEVKTALNENDRVIFGVLLLDFDLGTMGAVGTHNAKYDTWVLTPEIARDLYRGAQFGGHEMVITGYDDNAVSVDDHGREHKGLFTLRNSWGEQVGDKGNFYMSYDYFKVLADDADRIRAVYS